MTETPRRSNAGTSETILDDGHGTLHEATGTDVTTQYRQAAERTLRFARASQVGLAVIVDGSPSCGSTYIYDGTFTGTTIRGSGTTTSLLQANDIAVYPPEAIEQAVQHLACLERLATA